jgi:hypothetical protein
LQPGLNRRRKDDASHCLLFSVSVIPIFSNVNLFSVPVTFRPSAC